MDEIVAKLESLAAQLKASPTPQMAAQIGEALEGVAKKLGAPPDTTASGSATADLEPVTLKAKPGPAKFADSSKE
jgi:hypothetical protein